MGFGSFIKKAVGKVADFASSDGGASLLGSVIGGGASLLGGAAANSASAASSKEQMAFQERMSNTAYQRAAKDLEKAGLNRVLALGNPATAPSGSSYNAMDIATPAVNSANSSRRTSSEIKNMNLTSDNLIAQNEQIRSSTALNKNLAVKALADAENASVNSALTSRNLPRADAINRVQQNLLDKVDGSADNKPPNGPNVSFKDNLTYPIKNAIHWLAKNSGFGTSSARAVSRSNPGFNLPLD